MEVFRRIRVGSAMLTLSLVFGSSLGAYAAEELENEAPAPTTVEDGVEGETPDEGEGQGQGDQGQGNQGQGNQGQGNQGQGNQGQGNQGQGNQGQGNQGQGNGEGNAQDSPGDLMSGSGGPEGGSNLGEDPTVVEVVNDEDDDPEELAGSPAVEKDPSWMDISCQLMFYSANGSVGALLSDPSCVSGATKGSNPVGPIDSFSGNTLLQVKSPVPGLLTPKDGSLWEVGSGNWALEVSGSEQKLIRALNGLGLTRPAGEPCAPIDLRLTGLAHVPEQGARVMTGSDDLRIVACASAEVDPKNLGTRLLDGGSITPRVDGQSVLASSYNITYSLTSATPGVCEVEASRMTFRSSGTCDFAVSAGGVDVDWYTLTVLDGRLGLELEDDKTFVDILPPTVQQDFIPDSLEPIDDVDVGIATTDLAERNILALMMPNEDDPTAFELTMEKSIEQSGATFTANVQVIAREVDGNADSEIRRPLTPVQVSFDLDDKATLENRGTLRFTDDRQLSIGKNNFMPGQPVMAMIFSQRVDLGDLNTQGTFDLRELGVPPGNHTLRIVGMSMEGIVWSISVPVVIEEEEPTATPSEVSGDSARSAASVAPEAADALDVANTDPAGSEQPEENLSAPDTPLPLPGPTEESGVDAVCFDTAEIIVARQVLGAEASVCTAIVHADPMPAFTNLVDPRHPAGLAIISLFLLAVVALGLSLARKRATKEQSHIIIPQ